MEKKLDCVLLIDDNPDDNFFHERILRKSGKVKKILAEETASTALRNLRENTLNDARNPDLILLDINMPGMNGWDFLKEYCMHGKQLSTVVILTTSQNPDDEKKAGNYRCVSGFRSKPLTTEKLEGILDSFF